MEDQCRELHDKTRAQIFVVTVNTTEGEPVETFANELFAKWKIGEKKTDRGVLILFAIKDHKRWIEIGYGFEGILNDAKVGDIGREMVPDLKASRYDEAASIGLNQITQIIATDAGVTLNNISSPEPTDTTPAPIAAPPQSSALPPAAFLLFLFPIFFFLLLFIFVFRAARRAGRGSGSVGGSSFGDSSSDSFSSSDSGGDSFGGGDGGSSGGGGAGGDW
jgi:uncharacterized protein